MLYFEEGESSPNAYGLALNTDDAGDDAARRDAGAISSLHARAIC